MARTSKIILSKGIKLDKSYKQVLSLTETNFLNLLISNDHLVSSKSDYSFIRERGSIKVQETYSQCLKANYMAFQNPDYSNKWFFAFIDKVKYLSDSATEIYYTIDVWSTWFDYWDPKTCYIIRQHATTDVIGDNTVPEKLEHGGYVLNTSAAIDDFNDYAYIVVLSGTLAQQTPTVHYINMGGVVMNGFVYACQTAAGVDTLVQQAVSHSPQIDVLAVYMIPECIIPANVQQEDLSLISWSSPKTNFKKVMSRPTSLDGYTPVNKKLLTYPYQYCLFNNLNGASNILYFEKSGKLSGVSGLEDGAIYIRWWGVPSIGCSVLAVPCYYKGNAISMIDGLVLGKYPVLGWSEDAYTNWLTQNSVNNAVNWAKVGLQVVGGVATAGIGGALTATGAGAGLGAGMIATGIGGVANAGLGALETGIEYYKHSLEPDSYQGNINAGDIMTCTGSMGFDFSAMSISYEWAERLDKFFTRFGYAQNKVMYPNLLHRANYNFIQIAKDSTTAYSNNHNNICVPADDLESINNIFRNGVTVWNNHTNFGDYSVANGITS